MEEKVKKAQHSANAPFEMRMPGSASAAADDTDVVANGGTVDRNGGGDGSGGGLSSGGKTAASTGSVMDQLGSIVGGGRGSQSTGFGHGGGMGVSGQGRGGGRTADQPNALGGDESGMTIPVSIPGITSTGSGDGTSSGAGARSAVVIEEISEVSGGGVDQESGLEIPR
jgi:hypothetical protein